MSAVLSTGWQAGFLAVLPTVQDHARFSFRKLPAGQREEAIQEAIASACISYQLLAARGRLHAAHPSTLADYAVKSVRNGRHVGGRQDAAQDVYSPVARRRCGIRVLSYDVGRSERGCSDWKMLVIADRKHPIPDTAAFRIDFGDWLGTLTRRDRKIVAAFVRGERTSAVAGRFGITAGRVSQLRRKYEQGWRVFQGEIGERQVA